MWRSSSSGTSIFLPPSPRFWSASARRSSVTSCSSVSGFSAYTRLRDNSAEITSNDGFSVVAPIRMISPFSTYGRKASCWALLKRWISSTRRMVRWPSRRARTASAITALISLMPASTALKGANSLRVSRAMTWASDVLPEPGGPHRISDESWSFSIWVRSGLPGARMCSWPKISSSVSGRMRSASGRGFCRAASSSTCLNKPIKSGPGT